MNIAKRFERDGFAVVEGLADADLTARLGGLYDDVLAGRIACGEDDRQLGGVTRQVMLPHRHHEGFASNPAIDRARELSKDFVRSDEPEFLFSMLIHKPGGHVHETPWHQDVSYSEQPFAAPGTRWPGHVIAQFWLALDDVDETMGCMEFVPGEHTKPMPEHVIASGDPDYEGRLLTTKDPEAAYDLDRVVRCPVPAGSATVHSYSTPHRTGPNASDRGRRAFIFSFANAPLLAELQAAQAA